MCCHLSIVSAIALCVKGALPVAPRSDQRHIWFWVTKWCTTRIRTPASRKKPFRAPPLNVKERARKTLCNAVAVNAFGERALVWGERGCLRYARVGRVYLQMHHFVKTLKSAFIHNMVHLKMHPTRYARSALLVRLWKYLIEAVKAGCTQAP